MFSERVFTCKYIIPILLVILPIHLYCVLIVKSETTRLNIEPDFVDEWAVEVSGGSEAADAIAKELGFFNHGPIGDIEDIYLFERKDEFNVEMILAEEKEEHHISKRDIHQHTKRLIEDQRVNWVERQFRKIRTKRDLLTMQELLQIMQRDVNEDVDAARSLNFDDEMWSKQWYMDERETSDNRIGGSNSSQRPADLNVLKVWQKDITGKGIVVTVLDDGLEHTHDDLIGNYDPQASYDCNDKDDDPFPRYDPTNENRHGTRCTGEIGMAADNGLCGVGIAYNAGIGGIRLLDGSITDASEGYAINYKPQYVHIYSASWGPSDDGQTTEGPGPVAAMALMNGANKGRGGKGNIFVWASGNGGRKDSCGCDGYVSSIYTVSVASAGANGISPWYAEHCASTLTTAYSSGTASDPKIVSTDLHNKCTDSHSGTSAAAPLAAGIIALLLESNPDLTWRDVQHIIVWTSDPSSLDHTEENGWLVNGVGLQVSIAFGFGLMDAYAMIILADPDTWENVPAKHICENKVDGFQPVSLSKEHPIRLEISTSGCEGKDFEVRYLEHVQLCLTLNYTTRGDIVIYLTSPMGTRAQLLNLRSGDESSYGLDNWCFMSVMTWGENPAGEWIVEIYDNGTHYNDIGMLEDVSLQLHGTKEKPNHYGDGRVYQIYNQEEEIDQPLSDQDGIEYRVRQQLKRMLQ